MVVHAEETINNDVENLYIAAASHCKLQEIVVFVDSSDYFIGKEVLKLFNAVYEDKIYDLAYTNFLDANNQIGNLAFIPKKKVNRTVLATSNIEAPLFAVSIKTVTLILEDYLDDWMTHDFNERLTVNLLLPILDYLKGSSLYIP